MKVNTPSYSHTSGQLNSVSCPAIFLAAPSSGEGKTTVTAALARYFKNQGLKVTVFKTGPDYLDPQILAQASGNAVEQLDLWMCGEDYCQNLLYKAAQTSDLIIIEGVMGMFDGTPSSADLSLKFGIPIALVINVKGMAQTVAALAYGLAHYNPDIKIAGLFANACSTERHRQLIEEALPADIPLLAALKRDEAVALPERHLGLVQASEVTELLEEKFELGAAWIADGNDIKLPAKVEFTAVAVESTPPSRDLKDKRIGIAKDAAFSFIYEANVRYLQSQGASCVFFSPLTDNVIPEVDALWLPGGYPELYTKILSDNVSMRASIVEFFNTDKPILAECGGLLYCLKSLTTLEDETYPLLGILPGQGAMRGKRGCQGMQTAVFPEGEIRGHSHHRSRTENTPTPLSHCQRQRHAAPGEPIYRVGKLTASYLHLFFAANPEASNRLFLGDFTTFEE